MKISLFGLHVGSFLVAFMNSRVDIKFPCKKLMFDFVFDFNAGFSFVINFSYGKGS